MKKLIAYLKSILSFTGNVRTANKSGINVFDINIRSFDSDDLEHMLLKAKLPWTYTLFADKDNPSKKNLWIGPKQSPATDEDLLAEMEKYQDKS